MAIMRPRPLKVAVLVELLAGPEAGGHVKCWQRFADAARPFGDAIDLTVFVLGRTAGRDAVAPNVHFERLKPVLATDRIPGLPRSLPMTDLAPHHPALARRLADFDVLHATSAFAFARTARRVAKRRRIPLVMSIHDNLPALTRAYMRQMIGQRFGQAWPARLLLDRLGVDRMAARAAGRRVGRIAAASDWVLASRDDDVAGFGLPSGTTRLSRLRRGVDKILFNPAPRDRAWLAREFGVPEGPPLVLFVGRIDDSKNIMRLVAAARRLIADGQSLHVLAIGAGAREADVRRELGANVTLPGVLPHSALAPVYASADLFVFPSETEIVPNVVLEARAAGLPVVVSARDNGAALVERPGHDGATVGDSDPASWAAAIRSLLDDPLRRAAMGAEARRRIVRDWPTWGEVLTGDLLPVWQRVAGARRRATHRSFMPTPVLQSPGRGLL